jgi:hypothetical protein
MEERLIINNRCIDLKENTMISKVTHHVNHSLVILLPLMCLYLTSCSSSPKAPDYSDPLIENGISRTKNIDIIKTPAGLKNISLGILLTENTKKSIELVKQLKDKDFAQLAKFEKMGVQTGLAYQAIKSDLDFDYLLKSINLVLSAKFKNANIVSIDVPETFDSVDAILYLDIQVIIGTWSGSLTKIDIKGIFVDKNKEVIGEANAQGLTTIPYPAENHGFKLAGIKAVNNFAANF